jgi:hypothetical protein
MTESVDFPIVGSYNNQRVHPLDAERTLNMFEYRDPSGKKPRALINTSGLINTNTLFPLGGVFRAQFVFGGFMYCVVGGTIYRVDQFLHVVPLGNMNTLTGYVGVDANTFQVIFVDGKNGYIWDVKQNNILVTISDENFPTTPIDVAYLDGFFVVANGGTNTFQLSMFNQGLVWGPNTQTFTVAHTANPTFLTLTGTTQDYRTGVPFSISVSSGGTFPTVSTTPALSSAATYFAITLYTGPPGPTTIDGKNIAFARTAADAYAGNAIVLTGDGTGTFTITSNGVTQLGSITSQPGNIVACRTLHRRLFLFSANYTEVWENAGAAGSLPFRRNNNYLIEYGTPAINSISVGFDRMFFLSQDQDGQGAVMEVTGFQAVPVSNRALEYTLAQYAAAGAIADCCGFLVKENGLIFYRMNFTAANHTFVYNSTMSAEGEEDKLWHEEETIQDGRHPAQTHAYLNGINYVGSYNSAALYQLDSMTFTNDLDPIRRMRITKPVVPPGYQRIRVDRLQIDIVQGSKFIDEDGTLPIYLLTQNNSEILTQSNIPILLQQRATNYLVLEDPVMYLSVSKNGGQSYGYKNPRSHWSCRAACFQNVMEKARNYPSRTGFCSKI